MKRIVAAFVAAVAALASAGPAWAHEELAPTSFPTARPVFLTLSVANEERADLNKVTLTAPAGTSFGEATKAPPGWTANASASAVTWTGGAVAPERFDEWGVEVNPVNQPGTLTFKVGLGFTSGGSHESNVQVTVVAAGAPTTAPAAAPTAAVTSTVAPATSTTAAGERGRSSSRSNVALGLSAVAVVVSLVALGLAATRRRASTSATQSGRSPDETQDW